MIYCRGWVDKMTDEPIPICENCKDWAYGWQCELDFRMMVLKEKFGIEVDA